MLNLNKLFANGCRYLLVWACLLLLMPALLVMPGCSEEKGQQQQGRQAPPAPCVTLEPLEGGVPLYVELPGRAVSHHTSEVRPQVSGIILKRMFEEGSDVEQGQQLYQIDPAIYEAQYETALANQKKAETNVANSKLLADRYAAVVQKNAVSKQEYDNAMAAYRSAMAELAATKAAVKTAKINLDYTKVFAPVSGRIGISSVTEGALVTTGQASPLAYIQQTDTMYVDIVQSSSEYLRLQRGILSGLITQEKMGEIPVTITLEDGKEAYNAAALKMYDIDINMSTGAITMRAEVPNESRLILPGMFVRAKVKQGTLLEGLLVPQQAVQRNQKGQAYVLVVNHENTVEQRVFSTDLGVYQNSWVVAPGLFTPEGEALRMEQADARRKEGRHVYGLLPGERIIMEGSIMLQMTGGTKVTPTEYKPYAMKSPSEVQEQVRKALEQEDK
ncbi:efflux RND transporter periplasmic adaptor subunit [Desulfovibrio sp. OttesenSCG-928-C06]|nr:efflux RND transporter periplasmic adaptor subunit [Desulfovibrio sp. OttesenSCG-928-C06]